MAGINEFKGLTQQIGGFDRTKLFRPNLGPLSWQEFEPEFDALLNQLELFSDNYESVSSQAQGNTFQAVKAIHHELKRVLDSEDANFHNAVKNFKSQYYNAKNTLIDVRPAFVAAQIDQQGLLHLSGFEDKISELSKKIDDKTKETLEIIEKQKDAAEKVVQTARDTAAGVSFDQVQKEFERAHKHSLKNVLIWSVLSVLALSALVILLIKFYSEDVPTETTWAWHYTAIRLAILVLSAGLLTFFLRLFRAHLHMYQHNVHRRRLANSMLTFVNAVQNPNQRDIVLGSLIDAVSSFGTSGLLTKESDGLTSGQIVAEILKKR